MQMPRLVLFDYGRTIGKEDFDGLRGARALMPYIAENPYHVTPEEIQQTADDLNYKTGRFQQPGPLTEVPQFAFQHFLYEYLGIRFAVDDAEIERIFWDAAGPARLTPHMDCLLDTLRELNIPTGIISNISFTGKALARRIRSLCGDHPFLFILATSEYVFRKPDPLIFQLALRKAGVSAGRDVWYCGDSLACDVRGAEAAGITPIWYRPDGQKDPQESCLQIADWQELSELLLRMEKN